MVTTRLAPLVALTSLGLILSNASCTTEVSPSGSGGSTNTGGATGGGSGGTSPAVGGSGGGATGGSAGTGNVAGSSGNGSGGTLGGGSGSGGASSSGTGGGGSGGGENFTLTSSNLTEGAAFADKYTCSAAGFEGSLSPALTWTAGPGGTLSYAITFIDVTLTQGAQPSDLGYHWVIYNIPPTTLSLPEEFMDAASIGAAANREYLGPCPNFGGGTELHTYEFTVYALDTATLSITPTTGTGAVKDAEAKLEASNLASAKLSGTSDASPP
jgi:Raf kinase inhibitor-like YbhB/YbcL family protein